ncbi:hypothetical protein LTR10_017668 [Elasticomyces elasticus]|uniref:J domain-containing protein n=1 Tax=Exophiala sideris TaxID=1016849 RepID=A0ABR0JBK1_9EURO|nr:hypothetical protein LTR10_017668 [Elasticomyces elasticus]KAK5031083.1 hypothetical protein LTS07_004818 [Exophiala sideris]KAK5038805.1 hypothetical protein LTR13_003836 [Exophiala sideris]KAK5060688.1 hypothetical protein LTR69_005287 [Exophiala sideris]KAK5183601.1 hypothetical protein LTR44_003883 [Eurotiomycetes sp. CCFEE 6388]
MADEDYYAVLQIPHSADYAAIRSAYNRLVIKTHPDKGGSNADFIKVQQAYEALRDPVSRAEYDKRNKFGSFRTNEEKTDNNPQTAKPQPSKPRFSPTAAPFRPGSTSWSKPPQPQFTQPTTNQSPDQAAWTQYRDPAEKPKPRPRPKPKRRPGSEPESFKSGRTIPRRDANFYNEPVPTGTDPEHAARSADDVHSFNTNPFRTPSPPGGAPATPTRPGSQEPYRPSAASQADEPLSCANWSVDRMKLGLQNLYDDAAKYISHEFWCHLQHFQMRLVNRVLELQLRQATDFDWEYYVDCAQEDKQILEKLLETFSHIADDAHILRLRKQEEEGVHNMDVDDDEVSRRLDDAVHDLKKFLIEVLFSDPRNDHRNAA